MTTPGAPQPARRQRLSADLLYRRALALIDEEGLEALTMRRLAGEFGVEAASLYHHVPGKEALLDGVVSRMRAELNLPDPLPKDWPTLMETIFTEYHRVLAAHPNLTPLAGRHVETDPSSGLVYLVEQGLGAEDAVDLWQSIIAFTVGFSVFSSTLARTDLTDLPPELARLMAEWREATFARTLRILLNSYGGTGTTPTRPEPQPQPPDRDRDRDPT